MIYHRKSYLLKSAPLPNQLLKKKMSKNQEGKYRKFSPSQQSTQRQITTKSVQKIKNETQESINGLLFHEHYVSNSNKKLAIDFLAALVKETLPAQKQNPSLKFKLKQTPNTKKQKTDPNERIKLMAKTMKGMAEELKQFLNEIHGFVSELNSLFSFPTKQIEKSLNTLDESFNRKINTLFDSEVLNQQPNIFKIQNEKPSKLLIEHVKTEDSNPFSKLLSKETPLQMGELNIKKIQTKTFRTQVTQQNEPFFSARELPNDIPERRRPSQTERVSKIRFKNDNRNRSVTQKFTNFNEAMQKIKNLIQS